MKKIRHLELFAGIGGFRKAIDLIAENLGYKSQCIGFSEIDKYATTSYKSNYDTKNEVEIGDLTKFVEDEEKPKSLPNIDLLTGGFPCQSFSMMGKQLGLEDKRGNLFYSIIKVLKIKKPKYVLLENVRNLKTHNKGNTYKTIKQTLEKTGYIVDEDIFNTSDFGLPQHRRRIFLFAKRVDLCDVLRPKFDSEQVKHSFSKLDGDTSLNKYENVLDGVLDKEADEKYYLSKKIKPTILANGSKNFYSKSEINQIIARPLTATMVKMHRACQDNYYSDGFINSEDPFQYLEQDFTKQELATHKIRKLTPWEALKLQGFNSNFYDNASKNGISNHQLYKQSGNAVSINVVYAILNHLMKSQTMTF